MVDRLGHGGASELAELKRETRRKSCTTAKLRELRKHWSPTIRRLVAAHRNTSRTDVRYLLDDPDEWVRFHLAARFDLSANSRWWLARDPSMRVRRKLARTQRDPALLMALTADTHAAVRVAARFFGCWLDALHAAIWRQDAHAERALTEWMGTTPDGEMRRLAARMLERTPRPGEPYRRLMQHLARDPESGIAMPALRSIVRWGSEDEVFAICADHDLRARLGPGCWNQLRYMAAAVRFEGRILEPLASDPVAVIAVMALANMDCPRRVRKKAVRWDRCMRSALRIMTRRLWRVRLILTEPSHSLSGFGDLPQLREVMSVIRDAVIGDKRLSCWPVDDYFREREYQSEYAWMQRCDQTHQPLHDNVRSHAYCQELLARPYLRRRHSFAASVSDALSVRYDARLKSCAGMAVTTDMTIRLNPRTAWHGALLHELAHLLTHAHPQFMWAGPPLGMHGGTFAATMLDVVRVAYGRKARWQLRWQYFRHGVPVITSSRRRRRGRRMSKDETPSIDE